MVSFLAWTYVKGNFGKEANLAIHYKFASFIRQLLVTSEIAIEAALNFARVYFTKVYFTNYNNFSLRFAKFFPQQSLPLYSSE